MKFFNLAYELKKRVKSKYIVFIILDYAKIPLHIAAITYREPTEKKELKIKEKAKKIDNITEEIYNYIINSDEINKNTNIGFSHKYFYAYEKGIFPLIKQLHDNIHNYNDYIDQKKILGYNYLTDEKILRKKEKPNIIIENAIYRLDMGIIAIKNYKTIIKRTIDHLNRTRKYTKIYTDQ